MLNEPGGLNEPPPIILTATPANDIFARLRTAVDEVFLIESETTDVSPPFVVSYTGQLTMDSLEAYDRLDDLFKPLDHVPVFAMDGKRQVVRAMKGRFRPKPRSVMPNLVLFILTILSLLLVGASYEHVINSAFDLVYGLPYALCVLAILGTHELGHYFAARYHKVSVTLPYFIPMPLGGFGTLGAFIQLRELMRNRRVLLDVGAAGPLSGFVVAIPILLIGLATSKVTPSYIPIRDVLTMRNVPVLYGGQLELEGNSLLYAAAKIVVFHRFLPDGNEDVSVNQIAWAGWIGLLVTSINLIPLGQLDGGHIMYSLFGERARVLYFPIMIILGILTLLFGSWLIWLFLLFFLGRIYATPLDNITPLDPRRRLIAIVALIVFVLVFVPVPLQTVIVPFRP